MLTLTAVASNPESSKEEISHNRQLINMTVQSAQQSDSDLSEIQRTRLHKLHSLSFAYLSIPGTMCN